MNDPLSSCNTYRVSGTTQMLTQVPYANYHYLPFRCSLFCVICMCDFNCTDCASVGLIFFFRLLICVRKLLLSAEVDARMVGWCKNIRTAWYVIYVEVQKASFLNYDLVDSSTCTVFSLLGVLIEIDTIMMLLFVNCRRYLQIIFLKVKTPGFWHFPPTVLCHQFKYIRRLEVLTFRAKRHI